MTVRENLVSIVTAWNVGEYEIKAVRDLAESIMFSAPDGFSELGAEADLVTMEVLTLLASAHIHRVVDSDAPTVLTFLISAGSDPDWSTWRDYWKSIDFAWRESDFDDPLS